MNKWILTRVLGPLVIIAVILLIIQLADQQLTVFDDLGKIISGVSQAVVKYVKAHINFH